MLMINRTIAGTTDALSMLVLLVGLAGFAAAVLITRIGRGAARSDGRRDRASLIGIGLQALSYAVTAGPIVVTGIARGAAPRAILVGLLMLAAVGLFSWAARAMGDNWAIVASTRADHGLVTSGPFAIIRNPIYLAMGFVLLGVAVATNHVGRLILSIPLFAVGTGIRIRAEERLLGQQFGESYRAYAARVKRIIPGLI